MVTACSTSGAEARTSSPRLHGRARPRRWSAWITGATTGSTPASFAWPNFKAEGFDGRATFVHGNASNLPAGLGTFDTVVSCLTFHEVQDVEDKTLSLRQAIGAVRPGGRFAFIDLFEDSKFYPHPFAIQAAIAESGGVVNERVSLAELMPMPFPLKHKRVLGGAQLIAGTRSAAAQR
jgi:SAM-dependent methyltransferase